jgi:uncharacterized membrane-anchored protein YitT (DUF2179 family)
MVIIGNIPLFILGWRYLGGFRFGLRTIFAVVLFSIFEDGLMWILPSNGLTSDLLLNALYGGVISGIGYGLVYRAKGTSGGSDILGRILNHWRGISISQSYLLTDAGVMLLAGLSFSWENALYAIVSLYISCLAAEATLEGSNVVRTVMIITDQPDSIRLRIINELERGVTVMPAVGGYSGAMKSMLYCVLSRSEVSQIKALVRETDPAAFVVIGQAYEAIGDGFKRLE